MTDIIYNVLTRPIPSEPDKIDAYHLAKVAKDAKVKRIDDEDPSSNQQKSKQGKDQNAKQSPEQEAEKYKNSQQKVNQKELELNEKEQKGKGKFKDDDGVEHLDIFV